MMASPFGLPKPTSQLRVFGRQPKRVGLFAAITTTPPLGGDFQAWWCGLLGLNVLLSLSLGGVVAISAAIPLAGRVRDSSGNSPKKVP